MKKIQIICILFFISKISVCQIVLTTNDNQYLDLHSIDTLQESLNPRLNRPFGINSGIRWSPEEKILVTVSVNYFIIPQIELITNIGTDLEYGKHLSLGSRYHINKKHSDNRITPFSGLLVGVEYGEGFLQIPAGLNYLAYNGFETSLSLNYLFYVNTWQTLFLELKIGWRFKINQ